MGTVVRAYHCAYAVVGVVWDLGNDFWLSLIVPYVGLMSVREGYTPGQAEFLWGSRSLDRANSDFSPSANLNFEHIICQPQSLCATSVLQRFTGPSTKGMQARKVDGRETIQKPG